MPRAAAEPDTTSVPPSRVPGVERTRSTVARETPTRAAVREADFSDVASGEATFPAAFIRWRFSSRSALEASSLAIAATAKRVSSCAYRLGHGADLNLVLNRALREVRLGARVLGK